MKKWIISVAGVGLIATAVYAGYFYWFKEETVTATTVRTSPVIRGDLKVTVAGSGTVSAVNVSTAKASKEGELAKVLVAEGDMVEAGQVIATYAAPDHADDISKLETSLAKQTMEYDKLTKKYVAAEENDRENIAFEIESLKLDMASNKESIAELKAEEAEVTTVTAPIAGKVTEVLTDAGGQRVQSGTVIATITDYSLLQSVIQVDELDVSKVKAGQAAVIALDAFEDMEIEGKVTKIADEGTSSNGVALFEVTIEYPAQEGIRVGMSASAEVTIENKENVLMVPIEAIRQAGSQKMVLVAGESDMSANGGWPGPMEDRQGGAEGQQPPATDQHAIDTNTRTDERSTQSGGTPGAPGGEGEARQRMQGIGGEGEFPQRMQGMGGTGTRQASGAGNGAAEGTMRVVTVGVANETYIEILSGLNEGELVILPTVVSSTTPNNMMFPGGGGMPPGGGSFGGGGGMRSGGGASFQRGG